jgi:PIN domain-containing protein
MTFQQPPSRAAVQPQDQTKDAHRPVRQSPGRPRLSSFAVILDANVLVDSVLRDVLLHAAEGCLFRPLWTRSILDEVRGTLVRLGIADDKVHRLLTFMDAAFPEAMVTGYEQVIGSMTCDEKDRHVVAAAIVGRAQEIVTSNVAHFPESSVSGFGLSVVEPGEFLCDLLSVDHNGVLDALGRISAARKNPPRTMIEVLEALRGRGYVAFADQARVVVESVFGSA